MQTQPGPSQSGRGGPSRYGKDRIRHLVEHIFDPLRYEPLILLTPSRDRGLLLDPDTLGAELGGGAHIACLTDAQAAWELSEVLGPELNTYGGAVRVFRVGAHPKDDRTRHPLVQVHPGGEKAAVQRLREILDATDWGPPKPGPAPVRTNVAGAIGQTTADALARLVTARPGPRPPEPPPDPPTVQAEPEPVAPPKAPEAPEAAKPPQAPETPAPVPAPAVKISRVPTPALVFGRPKPTRAPDEPKAPEEPPPPAAPPAPAVRTVETKLREQLASAQLTFRRFQAHLHSLNSELDTLRAELGSVAEEKDALDDAVKAAESLAEGWQRIYQHEQAKRKKADAELREMIRTCSDLRDEVKAARTEKNELQRRIKVLEDQTAACGDTVPLVHTDPERQFRYEIEQTWLRTVAEAERSHWPLEAGYQIGPDWLDSLDALTRVDRARVLWVCVHVLTDRAKEVPALEVRKKRTGPAGSPYLLRADGASAWRCNVQANTPQAARLMWWRHPGGHTELGKVAMHDDVTLH